MNGGASEWDGMQKRAAVTLNWRAGRQAGRQWRVGECDGRGGELGSTFVSTNGKTGVGMMVQAAARACGLDRIAALGGAERCNQDK